MKGFLVFHAKNDDENLIKILQFLEVLAWKKNTDGRSIFESKENISIKGKYQLIISQQNEFNK